MKKVITRERRILFTVIAAPRNWPKALVAVTSPLPAFSPKRGGGYVELGDHVVVCDICLGLEDGRDVTFLVVGRVVELMAGLLVVVVSRLVVELESGCD